MKKLFEKNEILFAVLWIVVYVVGFGNADLLSERLGMSKAVTVAVGLIMTVLILGFIKKNDLFSYFGLGRFKGNMKTFLYFIPIVLISMVNLWNGMENVAPVSITILSVVSMCFVGFLEEVIFRGFLFKAMSKSGLKSAIIISSLTFGMGHLVNLLLGAPLFETLLQLVYASAIGFCYTAVFYAGGSIIPCILSHIFINATSIFAMTTSDTKQIMVAILQTAISVFYGVWILKPFWKKQEKPVV